mmetsp:Transcript_46026/g.144785  ORF Transcript_46026/g.144785 Transcript_46026/m.144785 type:complete len:418 (-) Transcript_46026:660-1913(-)
MCRTIPRATRHRTHVGASRRKAMGIRGEIVKIRGETERGSADGPRTVGPARRPRAWRRDPARRPAEYAVYGSTRKRWVSLWRGSEVGARVDGAIPELLLDAQQLVVLCEPLGPARRTRLDLSRLEADGEVGDEGVLRLAGAVGRHHAPARLLCHVDRLDRLGDGADLVHLEQQRVASLVVDGLLHARRVRHQQVVADDLARLAELGRHRSVRRKVVLVKGVLDRDHRVVTAKLLVHAQQALAAHLLRAVVVLRLEVEVVHLLLLLPKLGRRHVHPNLDLARVARLLNRLHHQVEPLLVVEDVRREAALVAHVARVLPVLLLDHRLEVVVHLGPHLHRLAEGAGTDGEDHELLHGQLVAGMAATVDDVERRDRHVHLVGRVVGQVCNVLVQRHTLGRRARLAHRHRHGEDGVGAELGL